MLINSECWKLLAEIPLEKTTRAIRLLETRWFQLQARIHEQFSTVWKSLVHVDTVQGNITINNRILGMKWTLGVFFNS